MDRMSRMKILSILEIRVKTGDKRPEEFLTWMSRMNRIKNPEYPVYQC
jgi:hypothetical protein